jgi:hypothetical protein
MAAITLTNPFPKPVLACLDDCFLMELFFDNGYHGEELRALNGCRMHLHALQTSDLCTADELRLTDATMEVMPDPHRSKPYSWPHTHRPEFKARSLWRAALTKALLSSTDSQVLRTTLCPFQKVTYDTWKWKYSPTEQRLFVSKYSCWEF